MGARRTDQSCEAQGSSWESWSVAALARAVLAAAMLACGTTDVHLNSSDDSTEASTGGESPSRGGSGNTAAGGTSSSQPGTGGESGSPGSHPGGAAGGDPGDGAGGESGDPGSVNGGEGGDATGVGGLVGVAPGCAERSTIDALYPLEEGAWWHHWTEENPDWVREDKLNYVCAQQDMPRAPGTAFPLVSFKPGSSYGVRWQSLEPCPNGTGSDILRHYDEKFAFDGTRTQIRHYCPPRQRTIDCQASTVQFPWHETYRDTVIDGEGGEWPGCEAIEIDPETCQPIGEIPEGCLVTVCPDDEDCHDHSEFPDEVFQIWQEPEILPTEQVEAGTFENVELHTNVDWQGETAQFHWARGVGKIYEESVPTEEEWLVAYCIPDGVHDPPPPELDPTLPDYCPTPD